MNKSVEEKFQDLLWGVQRSIRYHSRRQGFFKRCHTLVMLMALLAGSATIATFGSILGEDLPLAVKLMPAALITLSSALDMVIGFSEQAWCHADFMRQFIDLERRLNKMGDNPSEEKLAEVQADRLIIETREPPVLKVLDTLAHNELSRARGLGSKGQIKVSWLQRLLAPLTDFREHTLHH